MRKIIKVFAILMVLSLIIVPVNANPVYAEDDKLVVEINKENFPDPLFRNFLLNGHHYIWDEDGNPIEIVYDANKDGWLSETEISSLKQLLIQESMIRDLTGIEYLTALIEIGSQYSAVEKMDLKKNKNLLYLNCYHSGLKGKLDLTGNPVLEGVACHNNRNLTEVDVSGCPVLTNISCDNTGITELDVSRNQKLMNVSVSATAISELDVSKNPELVMVSAYNTEIRFLDFINNPKLEVLDASSSKLEFLDVSKNTGLVDLNVSGNPLAWLNVGNNPALTAHVSDSSITLEVPEGSFDITEVIPGIDASKVTVVSGAQLDGKTVSGYSFDTPVVYTYDCGVSKSGKLSLKVTATLVKAADDQADKPSAAPDDTDKPASAEKTPATGDEFSPVLWLVILALAGAVMALVLKRKTDK